MKTAAVLLCLAALATSGLPALAQVDLAGGADEGLLLSPIPVVITAAKKEQLATESPSSVTVITAEDIRRSGMTSIPDVLRQVVGLDVIETSASQWEVNARGIPNALNPRMLVLIDGRTVYRDLFGGTLWYLLPVVLEDIERIEVIRGPGSSLYGANAFSGVINIITKSVSAAAGTTATVARGEQDLTHTSVVHGGPDARLPYKVTAAYNQVDEWGTDQRSGKVGKANFLLEPRLGGRATLSIAGGLDQGSALVRISTGSRRPLDWQERAKYLMATYERPGYSVRAFWNHDDNDLSYSNLAATVESDVLDIEGQANREWGRHAVIVGAGARRTVLHTTGLLDRPSRGEDLFSVFVQDEYRPAGRLELVAGARYDRTALLGGRLSPRLSAVYQLADEQWLRFSAGKAFRRPTFYESYEYLAQEVMPGIFFVQHGNPDLDPETIKSYELEYRATPAPKVQMTAEVYRYTVDGFVLPVDVSPLETTLANVLDLEAQGLELAAEWTVSNRLSVFANGTWERIEDRRTGMDLDPVAATKLNAGVRYTAPRGLQADLYVHHVDAVHWLSTNASDEYTLVNARLAQVLAKDQLELALSVFNLFDDRHTEYLYSPQIGQRVTVSAQYRF